MRIKNKAFVVTDHVYPLFLADDKEKQYSSASPLHIKRNDGNFHSAKIIAINDLISYIKNTKDGQMQINIRPNKSFERV